MIQMCNNLVDLSMSSLVDVLSVVLFALRLFQYDGCALSFLLWITQNLLKKKKTRHRRRNYNSTKWYLSIKWEKEKPWQQAHASIPLLSQAVCVHQYFSKWSEYLRKSKARRGLFLDLVISVVRSSEAGCTVSGRNGNPPEQFRRRLTTVTLPLQQARCSAVKPW